MLMAARRGFGISTADRRRVRRRLRTAAGQRRFGAAAWTVATLVAVLISGCGSSAGPARTPQFVGTTAWPDGRPATGRAALFLKPYTPPSTPIGARVEVPQLDAVRLRADGGWTLAPRVTADVRTAAAANNGIVNLMITVTDDSTYIATSDISRRLVGDALLPVNAPGGPTDATRYRMVLATSTQAGGGRNSASFDANGKAPYGVGLLHRGKHP